MSRHYSKNRRLKYVLLALACTASFSLTGLAAACKDTTTTEEDEKKTSREDTQLLKNGNFEFFTVPDQKKDMPAPVYLINTPTSWTHGGSSSYTMSGIVGTSETAWKTITDELLADKLDINNALDSSDSNYSSLYVDYNGMKSSDIPYKNTYAALNPSDNEEEVDEHAKDTIENPGTRYNVTEKDGKLYGTKDGEQFEVFEDENGDYFFDEDFKEPFSHVLMLHNYSNSTKSGITQSYSSVEISLPANTAAEISVWVKTSNLLYLNTENELDTVKQDRGASITVTQKVNSNTLDNFSITNINTEKLIGESGNDYNGWVEYTVYVKACDFAASTIAIELGLGGDFPVSGYAFFDDVTVKKFVDLDNEDCTYNEYKNDIETKSYTVDKNVTRKAYCNLSSDASEKIFAADTYSRNGGEISYERFADCYHYLIDLASGEAYDKVAFTNFSTGLTVDENNYVSSGSETNNKFYANYNGKLVGISTSELEAKGDVKLPSDFTALDTSKDLIALVNANSVNFTSAQTDYYNQLNTALANAKDLPNSGADNQILVMFSAYGAAYTSSFEISVDKESHGIISFWLKTSDLNGGTAATVKLTDADDEDTSTNIALDTTDIVTDIDDDNKDIYDGWVQCFFFVENETDTAKTLKLEFSFGVTDIKNTVDSAYKAGWVALANMQSLSVDEDTFAYTGSGDHTASLTLSESEKKNTASFDEAYGSLAHEIENNIVAPSTYKGVNGESSYVVNNGHVSIPYDDINTNALAGLINKEFFVEGNYNDKGWYSTLVNNFVNTSTIEAIDRWNEIFGTKSVQPLIIINDTRKDYVEMKDADESTYKNYLVKDENGNYVRVGEDEKFDSTKTYYTEKEVLNYGFIGSDQTISADSYKTVSVRVKVSQGAIAYIYLVDTDDGKQIMQFKTPSYTFYYDTDGNVLKAEADKDATLSQQRENILYTLRPDGLYEDADGKLYANLWNYTKLYTDETAVYYNANGEQVSFDELVPGETYYDAEKHQLNHYLISDDNTKLYEYKNGNYYYIVEGQTQGTPVYAFDTQYARYDSTVSEDYMVVLDGNDANIANKWITINFVIHTGSESKSYRLELWSGERDKAFTDNNVNGGAILFDYSYISVSDDNLKNEYENEIIKAYQRLLIKNNVTDFETSTENISYYENLISENKIDLNSEIAADPDTFGILGTYKAHYFTYSLYDSTSYKPFNNEIADENATGYDYSIENYEESLAYLKVTDGDTYNVFVDYSTVDQSISLGTDTSDDSDEDTDDTDNSNLWLLISSILLVIALIFAMLAILAKDVIKKARRNKVLGKNNYNHNRTNRYMRRLHIRKDEPVEEESDAASEEVTEENNEDTSDETSEETTTESEDDGDGEPTDGNE